MKTNKLILVACIALLGAIAKGNAQAQATFYGVGAGASNQGSTNSGFGFNALNSNINGAGLTAFGASALSLNQSGEGNSAFGSKSLSKNVSGTRNVAVGFSALVSNTDGNYNVGVGAETLSNMGAGSNKNVALGYLAGANTTSGSGNLFLGAYANRPVGECSNQLVIETQQDQTSFPLISGDFAANTLKINAFTEMSNNSTVVGSPRSGLRFTNLTSASNSIDNVTNRVLSVNASGDVILVNDKIGTGTGGTTAIAAGTNIAVAGDSASGFIISSPTTNNLDSADNKMISTVNGVVAKSPIVYSLVNSIDGAGALTTTVNGFSSNPVQLPSASEVDGDVTNELSNLSLTGNVLTLSNPLTPGNSVTLPAYTDNDAQTLTLTGNNLSISNGNAITLPALTEVDGSVTNELQTLSLTGNQLAISNGNAVTLPLAAADGSETVIQAGSNVTISGTGTSTSPYVINSTATGSEGTDVNIYKDNGTITPANGTRIVTMNNNNLVFTNGLSQTNGKIYIGNSPSFPASTGFYRLFVEGGVLTEKVKVALRFTASWADYVFENNYKLMPLNEVEAFVKENKHLPGISSAENLMKEGLDLGEMQAKQMGKIEELTLYVIEQNKTIKKQSQEIEELKVLVNNLINKNK